MADASKSAVPADTGGEEIVAVTAREWSGYATADKRDAFLTSLDEHDQARTIAIARHLVGCGNPLPSATCAELGVPPGSSYGTGARAFLVRVGATW